MLQVHSFQCLHCRRCSFLFKKPTNKVRINVELIRAIKLIEANALGG